MKSRFEGACAGFLLINGLSYIFNLPAVWTESGGLFWSSVITFTICSALFIGSGLYLLLDGKKARLTALLVSSAVLVSNFYLVLSRSQWSLGELLKPTPVGLLLVVVCLLATRNKDSFRSEVQRSGNADDGR